MSNRDAIAATYPLAQYIVNTQPAQRMAAGQFINEVPTTSPPPPPSPFPSPPPPPVVISTPTIAALLAYSLVGLNEGQPFYVGGYNAASDGGGGIFLLTYRAPTGSVGSSTGVNNFTVFASNTAGAYFCRQFDGPYLIEWTGLDQTGANDASALLNAAINATPDRCKLTTYRPMQLKLSGPITINNRLGLTFAYEGAVAPTTQIGSLNWAGADNGTLLTLTDCDACVIKGWSLYCNNAQTGISVGTGAGSHTSSDDVFSNLFIYNNNNVANWVGLDINSGGASNNEFMTVDRCLFQGTGASIAVQNGIAIRFSTNVNTHYHTIRDCQINTVATGVVIPNGGVRFEGRNNISQCQVNILCSGAPFETDISFVTTENSWTHLKCSGGGEAGIRVIGNRIESCGATGTAIFDFTEGAPPLTCENNLIAMGTVSSVGGYLIDITGMPGGNPQRWALNSYRNVVGNVQDYLRGIDLISIESNGMVIAADFDKILTAGKVGKALAPPSFYGGQQLPLISLTPQPNILNFLNGSFTWPSGCSVLRVGTGDGSMLMNITPPAYLPNPLVFLIAHNALTIATTGNINYSGTLTDSQMVMLYFNGAKWVKSV